MSWTGAELQRFQDILLQAFPDRPALARMVKFHMGENLAAIADGSNLNDVVFALIGWAEARGKLDMLLRAAHTDNPDNADLQAFATQIGEAAVIRRLKEKAPVQYAVRLIPKRDFDVHGLLGKSERKYVFVGDYSEQRYKSLRQILAEFWAGDAFDRVAESNLEWVAIVFEVGELNARKFDLMPGTWKAVFRILSDPKRAGAIIANEEEKGKMGKPPRDYYSDDQAYWYGRLTTDERRFVNNEEYFFIRIYFGIEWLCFQGNGITYPLGGVPSRVFLVKNLPLSSIHYHVQDLGRADEGIILDISQLS